MEVTKLLVARIVDIAGSWLAIAVAAVVLLDDSLFGVSSATEPRVIEAATGIAYGIAGCLGISFLVANFPRFAHMLKTMAVFILSVLSVTVKLVSFASSILIRFGVLMMAALLAWVDATRVRGYEEPTTTEGRVRGSNLRVAFVLVALLAGGCLWQQRENFYIWSPLLEAMMCGITGSVALGTSVLLFSIEVKSGNREPAVAMPASEAGADRPLGTALLLSLFSSIACGLYLSLSMLVAQNTAFEYPSRVVYAINAGISIVVVITLILAYNRSIEEREHANRGFINGPWWLFILLVMAVMTVGLPYMLATCGDIIDFTTAGTLHVGGIVVVPLLGYFMLSRLAMMEKTGGYAAIVGSFGGIGLVVGIAGYLVGGNTYNMDFYVGLAFTVLLVLGVLTAWLYKPRASGDRNPAVPSRSPGNVSEVPA